MEHIIETYDPNTYVGVQEVLEWENVMAVEVDSFKNNQTW